MRRSQKGASMVEFAIGIVLFMVLMIGILDWAITFFIHQTLTWRVSEAVRYGAVYGVGTLTINTSVNPPTFTAVKNTTREAEVKNVVLCGQPNCTNNSPGIFGLTANDVEVDVVTNADTDTYTLNPVPRPHVLVTVRNYRVRQYTPVFGMRFFIKPITAGRPQECNEPECNTY